jgi:dihydroorotase
MHVVDELVHIGSLGHPRFFLGSDSAPHPRSTKECASACAGVYTGAYVLPYLAHILDSYGALHRLQSFACENGRTFYDLKSRSAYSDAKRGLVKLVKEPQVVVDSLPVKSKNGEIINDIAPFMYGQTLHWRID